MNQPRVGEPLVGHAIYERVEPVERVNLDVPFVQAEIRRASTSPRRQTTDE